MNYDDVHGLLIRALVALAAGDRDTYIRHMGAVCEQGGVERFIAALTFADLVVTLMGDAAPDIIAAGQSSDIDLPADMMAVLGAVAARDSNGAAEIYVQLDHSQEAILLSHLAETVLACMRKLNGGETPEELLMIYAFDTMFEAAGNEAWRNN